MAQHAVGFIDQHMSMLGVVFILNILVKGIFVLGSMGCVVLRINNESLVPRPIQSQCPERTEGICTHPMHPHRWSDFNMIYRQPPSSSPHSEESSLLQRSILLSQFRRNTVHVIEYVFVDWDHVMHCDCMHLRHPQRPISEWPLNLCDILNNGSLIQGCKEWPEMARCWVLEQLRSEFP